MWWNGMIYDNCKIYGPYKNPANNNREHIIVIFSDKTRKTVSYPKYIMEMYLGRYLDPNSETVDHIDNDITNNDITNLRLLARPDHSAIEALKLKEQEFVCSICSGKFILTGPKLHNAYTNRLRGFIGPFCSKSCSGKASHLSKNDPRSVAHNIKREKYNQKYPEILINCLDSDTVINNRLKNIIKNINIDL